MKYYRFLVKFRLEKFDEVVAELASLAAVDRFLADNKLLAALFKFGNYVPSDLNGLNATGVLVLIYRDGIIRSEFSFISYTELMNFLKTQNNLTLDQDKPIRTPSI